MSFFTRWFRKDSQVRQLYALDLAGRPPSPPRDYGTLAKEGYREQVIAYRCVNLIASAVARIPICVYSRGKDGTPTEIENHPIKLLLKTANPTQSWVKFVQASMSFYLIAGNLYVEIATAGESVLQPPTELWVNPPNTFKIVPGMNGMPSAYLCKIGSRTRTFPVDVLGRSNIIHEKMFHPTDPWYGMSPLEAAALDIDQLNEASKWNFSLMKRGARPSGALVVKQSDNATGALTDNQYQKLREQINETFTGSGNVGRPMLLEGGVMWQEMSLSPKDVEFPTIKKLSEKNVALAYGVPGQLVGVEDSQTFANYEQARMACYQDTIIPHAENFVETLNSQILPRYPNSANLFLGIDRDRIEALSPERDARWDRATKSDFITPNEKREMVDFGRYKATEQSDPADHLFLQTTLTTIETAAAPIDDSGAATDTSDLEDDNDDDQTPDPQETDDDSEDSSKSIDDAGTASGKSGISLLNIRGRAARQRVHQALVAKRASHEGRLFKQMRGAFVRERSLMASAFRKYVPSSLHAGLVNRVLDHTKKEFQLILEANLRSTVKDFGPRLIQQAKELKLVPERKDEDSVWDSAMESYIQSEVGNKITKIQGTTRKRILKDLREAMKENVEEGETHLALASEIENIYDGFTEGRARVIARTETHNAMTNSTLKAAESLRLPSMIKIWLHMDRGKFARDFHEDMNEVSVPLHAKFEVPNPQGSPDQMEGPGDNNVGPEQVVNCKCVLVFDTDPEGGGDDGE